MVHFLTREGCQCSFSSSPSLQIACQIVSVFQHYFFLAAFCWMLCEAVMIYILLVRVFGANDKKWIYLYLVLGWG